MSTGGTQSGTVRATAANTCGNTTKTLAITLGCRESEDNIADGTTDDASLSVYPNPAHTVLNVAFTGTMKNTVNIRLVDMTGRIVKDVFLNAAAGLNTQQIDVSTLSKGLYLLQVEAPDKMVQSRIVIE